MDKERRERRERYKQETRGAAVGGIIGGLIGLLALIMSGESVRNPQPHTMYTFSEWSLYLNRKVAENPFPTIVFTAAAGAIAGLAVSKIEEVSSK